MDSNTLVIVLAVALVIVAAIALWLAVQTRQSQELREHYGPEYKYTVQSVGDKRRAERELLERKERVEHLNIRPLSPQEQERFARAWHAAQARFVDDPNAAIADADRLVMEVMRVRGYPVSDFEQRAADISVDHPNVVSNYRAAHTIAVANQRGQANTEDLRKAMTYYRALFEDLLQAPEPSRPEPNRKEEL